MNRSFYLILFLLSLLSVTAYTSLFSSWSLFKVSKPFEDVYLKLKEGDDKENIGVFKGRVHRLRNEIEGNSHYKDVIGNYSSDGEDFEEINHKAGIKPSLITIHETVREIGFELPPLNKDSKSIRQYLNAEICERKRSIDFGEICRVREVVCPTSFSCSLPDTSLMNGNLFAERRVIDLVFLEKMLSYVETKFNDYKSDAQIVDRCCGPNEDCRSRFIKTELLIDKTADLTLPRGAYSLSGNITLGLGSLLIFERLENIESLLLHELGHACHFARNRSIAAHLAGLCVSDLNVDDDFIETLGEETYKCIRKAIHEKAGFPGCFGSQMQEAFADAIFSFKWNNFAHLTTSCKDEVRHENGFIHAKAESYMNCILSRSDVRNSVIKSVCE